MNNFNNARYLREAIDSALAQRGCETEVVIVDDGSTDESRAILESYGSQVNVAYSSRSGIGESRNRAVEMARGEFLCFLDSDDLMPPDACAARLSALKADPTIDAAFGHVREFITPEVPGLAARLAREPFEYTPGWLPSTMLIARESFFEVGTFSTTLTRGVGVDWFARFTEADLTTVMLPDVVLERRIHPSNQGTREQSAAGDYARVLKAALDRRRSGGAAEQ